MSSWKRVAAKNPPKPVAEFSRIVDVASASVEVGEVRSFPAPLTRPGQRQLRQESILPVIQAPVVQNNVAEVRGWPSPLMTREQRRSNRGVRELNDFQTQSSNEVRGFPNPIAPVVRRNANTPNNAKSQQPAIAPKLEQLLVTQIAAADSPNVSALLIIGNSTEFLEDTLLSIKRQTHSQWEGVIGILGTPTEDFIKKVKALVNNTGLNNQFSLNTALSATTVQEALTELVTLATTEYVAFLEIGDIWLPRKLDLQLKYLAEKKDVGIIGTQYRQFGEANTVVNLPAGELQKYDFSKGIPVIFSGVLVRRELAAFTTEFESYEYDFYIRNMLANVKIHNIDTIQVLKRVSRGSLFNPVDRHPELVREKYQLDAATAVTAVTAATAAAAVAPAVTKVVTAVAAKPVADDAAKKASDEAESKRNEMMEAAKKAITSVSTSS